MCFNGVSLQQSPFCLTVGQLHTSVILVTHRNPVLLSPESSVTAETGCDKEYWPLNKSKTDGGSHNKWRTPNAGSAFLSHHVTPRGNRVPRFENGTAGSQSAMSMNADYKQSECAGSGTVNRWEAAAAPVMDQSSPAVGRVTGDPGEGNGRITYSGGNGWSSGSR